MINIFLPIQLALQFFTFISLVNWLTEAKHCQHFTCCIEKERLAWLLIIEKTSTFTVFRHILTFIKEQFVWPMPTAQHELLIDHRDNCAALNYFQHVVNNKHNIAIRIKYSNPAAIQHSYGYCFKLHCIGVILWCLLTALQRVAEGKVIPRCAISQPSLSPTCFSGCLMLNLEGAYSGCVKCRRILCDWFV